MVTDLNLLLAQTAKRSGAQQRALQKRGELFPDAEQLVWDRKKHKGFTSIPRTLPYAMLLIDSLCKNAPPSVPYMVLLMRCSEEHILNIENPAMHAEESGYAGQRAVNAGALRMKSLGE